MFVEIVVKSSLRNRKIISAMYVMKMKFTLKVGHTIMMRRTSSHE